MSPARLSNQNREKSGEGNGWGAWRGVAQIRRRGLETCGDRREENERIRFGKKEGEGGRQQGRKTRRRGAKGTMLPARISRWRMFAIGSRHADNAARRANIESPVPVGKLSCRVGTAYCRSGQLQADRQQRQEGEGTKAAAKEMESRGHRAAF
jgi:hypothetical protein